VGLGAGSTAAKPQMPTGTAGIHESFAKPRQALLTKPYWRSLTGKVFLVNLLLIRPESFIHVLGVCPC
jgi:hypothetical protein